MRTKHLGTDFLSFVEGEGEIGPAITLERAVRTRLPLKLPPNSDHGRIDTTWSPRRGRRQYCAADEEATHAAGCACGVSASRACSNTATANSRAKGDN